MLHYWNYWMSGCTLLESRPYLHKHFLWLLRSLYHRQDLKREDTQISVSQFGSLEKFDWDPHIDHLTPFTFGTWAVPGFPQCGTAVGLQCSSVDVDLTAIIDHLEPAGALSGLCVLRRASKFRTFFPLSFHLFLLFQCWPNIDFAK